MQNRTIGEVEKIERRGRRQEKRDFSSTSLPPLPTTTFTFLLRSCEEGAEVWNLRRDARWEADRCCVCSAVQVSGQERPENCSLLYSVSALSACKLPLNFVYSACVSCWTEFKERAVKQWMDCGEGLCNKTDSLSAPSDRCHPQCRESSESLPPSALRTGAVRRIRSAVQSSTQVEGGQTRQVRSRGHNKREIIEMFCSADAPVALTCWVVGRGTGLQGYERPDSFFKFGKDSWMC